MRLQLNKSVVIKTGPEIMTGFLAAAVVEGDCWKEEVALVCEIGRICAGLDAKIYKDYKAPVEREFKEKNGLKQMPSKYRSTKSVIVNALKNNVELLDDDGFPRGKTEVEKDIKAHKSFTKVMGAIDYDGVALDTCGKLIALWPNTSKSVRELIITTLQTSGVV